jgi:hypothetical protein
VPRYACHRSAVLRGVRSHGKAGQRRAGAEPARELHNGEFWYAGMRTQMALVIFHRPEQLAIDIRASERCLVRSDR